jgi:hypothetical protein
LGRGLLLYFFSHAQSLSPRGIPPPRNLLNRRGHSTKGCRGQSAAQRSDGPELASPTPPHLTSHTTHPTPHTHRPP